MSHYGQIKLSKLYDVKLKKKIQSDDTEFYPRVINETNVMFSNNEVTLLNKALKYN